MVKRALLAELSTKTTDAQLAEILKLLDVEACSRRTIARAVESTLNVQTTYGSWLQALKLPYSAGGEFLWHCCNPFALLNVLASTTPAFKELLATSLERHPLTSSRPWRVIVYTDEASPGNLLAIDHKRKCHVLYWSFAEFGREALCREEAWLLGGIIRSSVASEISGGLSCVVKNFLRLFWGSASADLATHGCVVAAVGQLLFAKLAVVVADHDAIRGIYSIKGSAGLKPCSLLCKNVIMGRSELLPAEEGYFCDVSCIGRGSSFDYHTNTSFYESVDMLDKLSQTESQAKVRQLESILGLNHEPDGLLLCREIRSWILPVTQAISKAQGSRNPWN